MNVQSQNGITILPTPLRVLAGVGLFLLGFVFFPLFILGGLIVWSVFDDSSEKVAPDSKDLTRKRLITVDAARAACGSVAETGFLDAMVSAYRLEAGNGALEGNGLRLQAQVPMGAFRVYQSRTSYQYYADFLVDRRLVVEIDGAAYHSSAKAVAYDTKRDADMRRDGYKVLRIPARVVFDDPARAVRMVEAAR